MYRRPSKRTQFIQRMFIYALMLVAIVTIVGLVLLFTLGYRLDSEKGLEQGALLQFNTQPTGATVTIDGKVISARTPSKSTVLAGTHDVTMSKAGYDTWSKTVNLTAGTLSWLDYALLIPTNRPVESVASYAKVAAMVAAPNNKTIIIHEDASSPLFQLADLRDALVKSTTITLTATSYSPGTTHAFAIDSWDKSGRFVLLKHKYDDKTEWIMMDTQDLGNSKNITSLLDVDLAEARFSGNGGAVLYGLVGGTIRKLDLDAATISRPLVSNVTSFDLFDTNVITYIGTTGDNPVQYVAGVYSDGDQLSHVLKTTASADGLRIATTRYFNDNYVAISTGKDVTILKGSYPHSAQDTNTLQPFATFSFSELIQSMSFSPGGSYLTVQSGQSVMSYDVEHMTTSLSRIETDAAITKPLQWLDAAYLYGDYGDQLTIREFDGTNLHMVNALTSGFDVTLSPNGRYIYSMQKVADGSYSLQRVKLILE